MRVFSTYAYSKPLSANKTACSLIMAYLTKTTRAKSPGYFMWCAGRDPFLTGTVHVSYLTSSSCLGLVAIHSTSSNPSRKASSCLAPAACTNKNTPLNVGYCCLLCAGRDSNPRRHKPADLQSAPIDHSGTDAKNTASRTCQKNY